MYLIQLCTVYNDASSLLPSLPSIDSLLNGYRGSTRQLLRWLSYGLIGYDDIVEFVLGNGIDGICVYAGSD